MASPKLFRVPIGGDLPVKASRAIGRSVVRKFLVLIEAGRIVVELPTGDRVERTGRLPGLIQRFVFPGGFLPSKTFLREAPERADLKIVAAENFGESYALTSRKSRRRFLEKRRRSNGSASTRRSGGFGNTTSATARPASDLT
jgi:cyclopropane fatty-acyl-phospholipid synthase-like methyltransferase